MPWGSGGGWREEGKVRGKRAKEEEGKRRVLVGRRRREGEAAGRGRKKEKNSNKLGRSFHLTVCHHSFSRLRSNCRRTVFNLSTTGQGELNHWFSQV